MVDRTVAEMATEVRYEASRLADKAKSSLDGLEKEPDHHQVDEIAQQLTYAAVLLRATVQLQAIARRIDSIISLSSDCIPIKENRNYDKSKTIKGDW